MPTSSKISGRTFSALDLLDVSASSGDIESMRFLSERDEATLARAWRDHHDIEARNRLVMSHLAYAKSLAGKFGRNVPDKRDLMHEAVLGLLRAAEKFDPDMGWRFSTYAQWWVRSFIQDHLMQTSGSIPLPRNSDLRKLVANLSKTLDAIEREARERGETLPSGEIISRASLRLNIPARDIETFRMLAGSPALSLNAPLQKGEDDSGEIQDFVADPSDQATEILERENSESYMRDLVNEAVNMLSERERIVIRRRRLLDEPDTLNALSMDLGITRERVRQIEVKALQRMETFLKQRLRKTHNILRDL